MSLATSPLARAATPVSEVKGEKCETVLLTEMAVGKAMPAPTKEHERPRMKENKKERGE